MAQKHDEMILSAQVPRAMVDRLDRLARAQGAASRSAALRAALDRGMNELEAAHERWAAEVEALRKGGR